MGWRVVSPLVGVPGAPFIPPPGTNVDALANNGFIEPDNTSDAPSRPAGRKVKPSNAKE